MKPLRIAYLLEDTDLSGGTRVVIAQADALIELGHDVTIITRGAPLTWRHSHAKWIHVTSWDEVREHAFDFVVGTFWTTVAPAYELAGDRAVHLCQGYEGAFSAYASIKDRIDAAYRLPIAKITVSPNLVDVLRQFHPDATWIGQIVDRIFFQPHGEHGGRLRVLLAGQAEADMKGIEVGYEAVRLAREGGAEFDLIRVSPWPVVAQDRPEEVAEFHVAISTDEMARLIASCDIFLASNRRQEGFGLPAAEALASGLALVMAEIPSFLSWSNRRDFARFAPEGDVRRMAAALCELTADASLRRELGRRGREIAEQFRPERVGARLSEFFSARARTRTSGR